jgi:hypothetical protein
MNCEWPEKPFSKERGMSDTTATRDLVWALTHLSKRQEEARELLEEKRERIYWSEHDRDAVRIVLAELAEYGKIPND